MQPKQSKGKLQGTSSAPGSPMLASPTLSPSSSSSQSQQRKFNRNTPLPLFMYTAAPVKAAMERNQDLSRDIKDASNAATEQNNASVTVQAINKAFHNITKAASDAELDEAYIVSTTVPVAIGVLRKALKWIQPEWAFLSWDPLYSMPPSGTVFFLHARARNTNAPTANPRAVTNILDRMSPEAIQFWAQVFEFLRKVVAISSNASYADIARLFLRGIK